MGRPCIKFESFTAEHAENAEDQNESNIKNTISNLPLYLGVFILRHLCALCDLRGKIIWYFNCIGISFSILPLPPRGGGKLKGAMRWSLKWITLLIF
jgi:hypothetical protein